MASAAHYDWNAKATFYQIVPVAGSQPNEIVSNLTAPPADKTGQDAFVHQHGLIHGDVVNFGEHRQSESFIVIYDATSAKYSFAKNPDDTATGYLTIPKDVLINVDDATFKYGNMINALATINMHINRNDKFLKEKFKVDIPEEYVFDLHYQWGGCSEFFVNKQGENKWHGFDLESDTWDDIVQFFVGAALPQSKFNIKVTLDGEEFISYKEKYGKDKYAWMKAVPNLPKSWKVEKGQSRAGPDFCHWDWHFSGPSKDEAASKTAVEDFLDGFTYSYN